MSYFEVENDNDDFETIVCGNVCNRLEIYVKSEIFFFCFKHSK